MIILTTIYTRRRAAIDGCLSHIKIACSGEAKGYQGQLNEAESMVSLERA